MATLVVRCPKIRAEPLEPADIEPPEVTDDSREIPEAHFSPRFLDIARPRRRGQGRNTTINAFVVNLTGEHEFCSGQSTIW